MPRVETHDLKIEQPYPFLRIFPKQASLLSKKRKWLVKICGQFFDFPSRLAKVEEMGLSPFLEQRLTNFIDIKFPFKMSGLNLLEVKAESDVEFFLTTILQRE